MVVASRTRRPWEAGIAQWLRLHLPFCRPGFDFEAHHLRFYSQILYYFVMVLRKSPGLAQILNRSPKFESRSALILW